MHPVEAIRFNQYKVSVPTMCEAEDCEARVDVYVAWCDIGPSRHCDFAGEGWDVDAPNLCPACEAELDAEAIEDEAIGAVVDHTEALRDEAADNAMDAQRAGD